MISILNERILLENNLLFRLDKLDEVEPTTSGISGIEKGNIDSNVLCVVSVAH